MAKSKSPIMDLETDEDGWIGGSSQSIYARKQQPSDHASPPPAAKQRSNPSPVTPGRDKSHPSDGKTSSLLERIDMAQNLQQTPPPKNRKAASDSHNIAAASTTPSPSADAAASPFNGTPSPGIRRPGAKLPSPLPLTSPARKNGPTSPLNTRTPLSASHPIPETPLKLSQRGGPQTPATPHWPLYPNTARSQSQEGDTSRTSGLGLGLTPLKTPVPLAPSPDSVRSPLNEALNLRGRAASNASIGSPLKSSRNGAARGEPLALDTSSSSGKVSNDEVDAMLDRVRSARSGLGTSASMWAPKPAASAENQSSTASGTSHTIGSGFSSSNLLGVQTGLDRKRPSHRPNGLQLSLGQEISVMQNLEENAEEDSLSSAAAGETFKIHPPPSQADQPESSDWHGNVVPPTPALGCDSPSSDDTKPPSRSLDAFGWGSQPPKPSLFSNLPSSSTLEANWSGDDDDVRKDDVEMFQDMQNRAKASTKERRNSNYGPLPPPPINFAKSRTPSPTHRMLAKSPQLDGPSEGSGASKLNTVSAAAEAGAGGKRLSPASARSQLHSEDSDGDADVEGDKPKSGKDRKASKKHDQSQKDSLQVEGGLEKKRSLKRDKSERIRGRRASQSKDKDVDRVKMSAADPPASAKVSLPTTTLPSKGADELVAGVNKVNLSGETPDKQPDTPAAANKSFKTDTQTPVAQRVQSIPTIKDDLFSSPAEPKVGLPNNASTAKDDENASAAAPEDDKKATAAVIKDEEERSKESVPATPEPAQPKFDWAADDDELDDELPDLDDWGVTLSPAKPSTSTFSSVDAESNTQTAQNGKASAGEDKVWRRGSKLPPTTGGGKSRPPPTKNGDALGIRIAGRAKSASLSPEPERPPASTPYGRWKQEPKAEEISIKGTSSKARPRIAADLGALAKLLEPAPTTTTKPETGAKDSMHAPTKGKSPQLGSARGGGGGGGGRKKSSAGRK